MKKIYLFCRQIFPSATSFTQLNSNLGSQNNQSHTKEKSNEKLALLLFCFFTAFCFAIPNSSQAETKVPEKMQIYRTTRNTFQVVSGFFATS